MNGVETDRSKPWNIYTGSDQSGVDSQAPWKSFGTSMNAISFGFVATAILISMFLIMAIFEHLFKPNSSYSSSQDINVSLESGTCQKLGNPNTVTRTRYARDMSVVMPGQKYPTYIAQPAPFPCQREGIYWPSHYQQQHNFIVPNHQIQI